MNWPWKHSIIFDRANPYVKSVSEDMVVGKLEEYIEDAERVGTADNELLLEHESLWTTVLVRIAVRKNKTDHLNISTTYQTSDIFWVGLVLIVLFALLGSFRSFLFWGLGLAVGGLYIVAHNWYLWFGLLNMLRKFPLLDELTEETVLKKVQDQWDGNIGECPACGAAISQYETQCSACGLHVRSRAKPYPVSTSKYAVRGIIYKLKEKKK